MKAAHLLKLSWFGMSSVLLRRKKPILGTIILTDKCNLTCKHCSVNNITAEIYPYQQIKHEMKSLYNLGVRILFFCGGETFLWEDQGMNLRSLVAEAKRMGFYIVNVVTNGTYSMNLPEADLILLSLDGDRERHNLIRGDTYDLIMDNIDKASCDNICLYMAINQINKGAIESVCRVAESKENVRAVSFNFHTPYPDTAELSLTSSDKKKCCELIERKKEEGSPIFNLKSAFPYLIYNTFPTPCHQCVVMEKGKVSVCGRCIAVPGLCDQCGYFFAAEYALIFSGHFRVIAEMFQTYLRYV